MNHIAFLNKEFLLHIKICLIKEDFVKLRLIAVKVKIKCNHWTESKCSLSCNHKDIVLSLSPFKIDHSNSLLLRYSEIYSMPHVHVLVKIWCTMWSWSVVFLPSLVMFTLILEGLFCMMASCGIAVLFRTREHAQISRTGPCAQSRAVYIQQSATQSCWLSCSTVKTVCLFVCLTFFPFFLLYLLHWCISSLVYFFFCLTAF